MNDFLLKKAGDTSRRKFLYGTGSGLAALTTLSTVLHAKQSPLTNYNSQVIGQANPQKNFVVFNDNNAYSIEFASVFDANDCLVSNLGLDAVRLWRDGFGDAWEKSEQPLVGLTNWSDYRLIRELALEQKGMKASNAAILLEVQHNVTQGENVDWVTVHANDVFEHLQEMPKGCAQSGASGKEFLSSFCSVGSSPMNSQSLFTWIIA